MSRTCMSESPSTPPVHSPAWFTASIALTQARLVAIQDANTSINVPLTDERLRKMQFSVEEDGTLLVSFDPALFHTDWSGTMEYRFKTEQAGAFLDKLRGYINHS